MCQCYACLYLCTLHSHLVPAEVRNGHPIPWIPGVIDSWKPLWGYWESNPGGSLQSPGPSKSSSQNKCCTLSGIPNYTGLFSCLKIAHRILSAFCSFTSLCYHFLLLMVLLPPADFLLHPLSPQAELRKRTTGVARITSAKARAGWERA